jgi:hypothetical protein
MRVNIKWAAVPPNPEFLIILAVGEGLLIGQCNRSSVEVEVGTIFYYTFNWLTFFMAWLWLDFTSTWVRRLYSVIVLLLYFSHLRQGIPIFDILTYSCVRPDLDLPKSKKKWIVFCCCSSQPSSSLFTFIYRRLSQSQNYVTTDGQSASRPVCLGVKPHMGSKTRFFYCQTVAGLLRWSTLSDGRMGLSFTIAAGPRQRSHIYLAQNQ